jgi:hypothetical protein
MAGVSVANGSLARTTIEVVAPQRRRAEWEREIKCLTDLETGKTRGRHPDDGEWLIDDRERAADCVLAAAEMTLPERVTDDCIATPANTGARTRVRRLYRASPVSRSTSLFGTVAIVEE